MDTNTTKQYRINATIKVDTQIAAGSKGAERAANAARRERVAELLTAALAAQGMQIEIQRILIVKDQA